MCVKHWLLNLLGQTLVVVSGFLWAGSCWMLYDGEAILLYAVTVIVSSDIQEMKSTADSTEQPRVNLYYPKGNLLHTNSK